MPCIYVLKSTISGKQYIGASHEDQPQSRLNAHNLGKTRSTKNGKPWVFIYSEVFEMYTDARKREIFLKSGQGRQLLKQLLK